MRGEEATFDPRTLLKATIGALGTMNVSALESLKVQAETVATQRVGLRDADVAEALMMKQALEDLLGSTERSLRVLRGMHEAGVRRVEDAAWAR